MTADNPDSAPIQPLPASPLPGAPSLADRIAVALARREPGWRLPRRSSIAKKHGVTLGEIDVAIGELARRSLVRRLPDGQLYRASPAEHWIAIEGAGRLSTRLDPMGNIIECRARDVSWGEAPADVAAVLGLPAGASIQIVHCAWSAAGNPVAVSTAYLREPEADDDQDAAAPRAGSAAGSRPATAVSVTVSPPQPDVARALRLGPAEPASTVTVRFDDSATRVPAGLTVVTLRLELFRVAIDTTEAAGPRAARQ
jgi:DNA-binding GntR family transcriptional regulator